MKIQGRLMQARFIEIHQVFEKMPDTFITDLVYCFELVLWDAALVRFLLEEEFLASLWDRLSSCIVKNLGNY